MDINGIERWLGEREGQEDKGVLMIAQSAAKKMVRDLAHNL